MEYERSRQIGTIPEAVFAFVTDVRNLPLYVPTIESAEMIGEERVRLRGSHNGATFVDEGRLQIEPDRHRMEWRVEPRAYHGWMTVTTGDRGAQVVVHLSLPPRVAPSGRPLDGERAEEPDPIAAGLEAALDSLRNLLEGTGGKVQPNAA